MAASPAALTGSVFGAPFLLAVDQASLRAYVYALLADLKVLAGTPHEPARAYHLAGRAPQLALLRDGVVLGRELSASDAVDLLVSDLNVFAVEGSRSRLL